MVGVVEVFKGFFSLIRTGKSIALMAFLSDGLTIDDPLLGKFIGVESAEMYLRGERIWLSGYEAGIESLSSITGPSGMVIEYAFHMTVNDERIELPVALAADTDGERVTSIRIYYSTWPLTGKHSTRAPILKGRKNVQLPDIIEKYMNSIRGTDVPAVLELFESDGYVREPSGPGFVHRGLDELRNFYTNAIGGGGIPLTHCNAVSDGITTAVEYFFDEWNGVTFPPQAGVAVYETGKNGKIKAARIYDDVDPPF